MLTWITTAWASRMGKPLLIGGGVLLLLGLIFLLGRCSKDDYEDDYRAQVDQTTRSSDAAADAAESAIDILEGRVATEDAIDQIVTQTVEQIDRAASVDEVHAAVLAGICQQPSHQNDPACMPSAENHR